MKQAQNDRTKWQIIIQKAPNFIKVKMNSYAYLYSDNILAIHFY